MKRPLPFLSSLWEWATLGFGLIQSRDLLTAWRDSPKDHGGWIILLIWLLPFAQTLIQHRGLRADTSSRRTSILYLAIGSILAGSLGDLNALIYFGLALALSASVWERRYAVWVGVWLATSVAWMPAFSYLARSLPTSLAFAIKLIAVTVATTMVLWCCRQLSR